MGSASSGHLKLDEFIPEASKDEELLHLLRDYITQVDKPGNRRQYEERIKAIEKLRGYDVKFIHPQPVYVIKLICGIPMKKYFINVCTTGFVTEATSEIKKGNTTWQIPIFMCKPREFRDLKNRICDLYDVLFHPNTMKNIESARFRNLTEEVIFSSIEEKSQVSLEKKAVKYPKVKYKGKPQSLILIRGSGEESKYCEPIEAYYNKLLLQHQIETTA